MRLKRGRLPLVLTALTGVALAACAGPMGGSDDGRAVSESRSTSEVRSVTESRSTATGSSSTTESSSVAAGRISGDTTNANGVHRGVFEARAGQTVVLEYEAKVRDGELLITFEGPSGNTLWEAVLAGDRSDRKEYVAREGGRHTVLVRGEDSSSAFTVSWTVQ